MEDLTYTSQMCKCGHFDKGDRNKEAFCCKQCGYPSHADVNASINIAKAVSGLSAGLINGYSEDTFRPGLKISREQIASLISHAYRITEKVDGKPDADEVLADFKDVLRLFA